MGRAPGTRRAARGPMTLDLPAYGSDPSGLVCGYRFGPDGAGRAIDTSEALSWLRRDDAEKARHQVARDYYYAVGKDQSPTT